jgi:Ni/Fe-hydrogenase subunit HybB-like protein
MTTISARLARLPFNDMHQPGRTGKIVLALVALVALSGVVSGIYRLFVGLGPTTNLTDAYPWGLWIGFDFTLIAFAGVGFTMAAIVHVLHLEQYKPMARAAVLTGFLGYVSVLVILLLDLGRPDRFWGFLVYWNHHSPLFEISWCILLYTIVLTLEFAPLFFEGLQRPNIAKAIHRVTVPVVIAGVTLSTLHQSTLGTLYLAMPHKMHPLWWSWPLPILFYISSIGAGLAAMIFIWIFASKVFGRKKIEMNLLQGLAKGSIWVWVVYAVLRLGDLLMTGMSRPMFAFDGPSVWFWIEMILMALVPIVLFSLQRVRESQAGLFIVSLLVILGVLANRFNATLTAQYVNRFTVESVTETARYVPHLLEWVMQIGILAVGVLVWYLAARFLPVMPEAVKDEH